MARATLFALAVLLTGCATAADLRATDPIHAATLPGQYLALAGCVAEGIEEHPRASGLSWRLLDRPDLHRARVTGSAAMLTVSEPSPIYEVTIAQAGETSVRVEARTTWAWGEQIQRWAWPIVEQCAGGGRAKE